MIGKDIGERSTKLETSGVMQRTIATMPKPDKKSGINFLSRRKNLLGLLAFGDSLFQQGLLVEYHRRCDGSHQIRQLQLLVQAQLELQPRYSRIICGSIRFSPSITLPRLKLSSQTCS